MKAIVTSVVVFALTATFMLIFESHPASAFGTSCICGWLAAAVVLIRDAVNYLKNKL